MLVKSERLRKSSEFSAVYNSRRSVANSLLILYVGRKNPSNTPARVGFVVGKKVSKKAVKRNRIKRMMREAYKQLKKDMGSEMDWQRLIFIARPGLFSEETKIRIDYQQIYNAIVDCIQKARKKFGGDYPIPINVLRL